MDDRPTHIFDNIHVWDHISNYVITPFDHSEKAITARFEYFKYGMGSERRNWMNREGHDWSCREISPPDTLASDDFAVIEAFTKYPWHLYAWEVCVGREKEIVSNIYRICDLGLIRREITTLRGVCKSWSKRFKTNLEAVQGNIELVNPKVVACYFETMLLRTGSEKDRLHPKLNVRYYV